ncbi:MAG: hypothetical protein AAF620_07065 [Bacteroidota bacterium]
MKKKFLTALVIVGSIFFTACQEDETMDELIQDTQSQDSEIESISSSTNGDGDKGGGSGVGN